MSRKIHPASASEVVLKKKEKYVLTVWKRSSMSFQGTDGFTVFDSNGKLVFRVDNYSRKNSHVVGAGGGLLLMDGVGNALLTFKPQMMSMHYQWNAYGEEDGKIFSMRSSSSLFHKSGKDVAEIFLADHKTADFRVEGSFRARNCKIKAANGEVVAIMARKRVNNTTILLSDDVFSLVIQPGFDSHLIMAFIIILDRISNRPFAPFLCS